MQPIGTSKKGYTKRDVNNTKLPEKGGISKDPNRPNLFTSNSNINLFPTPRFPSSTLATL